MVSDLEPSGKSYGREDYAAADTGSFVVCMNMEGKLEWSSGYVEKPGRPKFHVIEVLAETGRRWNLVGISVEKHSVTAY